MVDAAKRDQAIVIPTFDQWLYMVDMQVISYPTLGAYVISRKKPWFQHFIIVTARANASASVCSVVCIYLRSVSLLVETFEM